MMIPKEQEYNNSIKMSDTNTIKEEYCEADVDLILGMPSKDCSSFGICKIIPIDNNSSALLNRTNAVRGKLLLHSRNDLEIKFYTESMSERTKQKYFGTPFFLVNETVKTPHFVNAILERCFIIHKGKYPITKKEKYYKVSFKPMNDEY